MSTRYTSQVVAEIAELYGSIQLTRGISESAKSPVPDENRLRFLKKARDVELPRLRTLVDSEIEGTLKIGEVEDDIANKCSSFESMLRK